MVKDTAVPVSEEATLLLLDALLVVAEVSRLEVLQTGSVLSIRHTSVHLLCKAQIVSSNAQLVSIDLDELLLLFQKTIKGSA
jgi:hypothetical protein